MDSVAAGLPSPKGEFPIAWRKIDPQFEKESPPLGKKKTPLGEKRPHLAKKKQYNLMLAFLWQGLYEQGEGAGGAGVLQ